MSRFLVYSVATSRPPKAGKPASQVEIEYKKFVGKIKNLKSIERIVGRCKEQKKVVVLVTGVYDILHIGHVRFLKKAKKAGDVLIVALDGDRVVRHLKGGRRPINWERDRAEILEGLVFVDYLFIFNKRQPKFEDWLEFCRHIKPDILAVTQNDPLLVEKRKSLSRIGCKVKIVSPYIRNQSTTRLTRLLKVE